MISIFRKEMKKWHSVLWVVFVSMAVSGVSLVFWRSQGEDATVANVDGVNVTGKDFKQALLQMQRQFAMISAMYGVPFDVILKTFAGGQDVHTLALDNSIKNALWNNVEKDLNIRISSSFFNDELIKSLPQGIADQQGRVNMDIYQNYLERMSMTPAEFEQSKEEEFKREAVNRVIGSADYVPHFIADYENKQDSALKTFIIVKFDQSSFKENPKDIKAEDLERFYNDHKETYRIPEKKQAQVVHLTPKMYEGAITIDEQAIQAFYDKNKANRYRIPPKVRVRHIFLNGHSEDVRKKAQDILEQVKKDATTFGSLAKKYSQDKASASDGGLTDYFSRQGTFDPAFEKEAFKLMKKGDLSSVVQTASGFEIIMLDDRINASEKALRAVQDEIVTILKDRKALNLLKSDLESLMHQIKTNAQALDGFIKQKHLKVELTDWLIAQDDAKKEGYDGKLIDRLFNKTSSKKIGYFMHADEYVLYQIISTEKSHVQAYVDVENKVKEDLLAQKSIDNLKHFVKSAKGNILTNKRSLKSYKDDGFKLFETDLLKRGDSIDALKDVKGLTDRMFILDDNAQVLEFRSKGDIYLIQLEKIEQDNSGKNSSAAKHRAARNNSGVVNGFIASLQRNAKITVNETL
ncbi:hypothetical protein FJ364_04475, partial [Candidatus Dependentiae bacterium]|nr:hypothetical protein [Candidatus Dependentiae bacterium]